MEEKGYITLLLGRCRVIMTSSFTYKLLVINRENPKLFYHLLKYITNLPSVDIIDGLDTEFPKSVKVYIKLRNIESYYIIKDRIDSRSFIDYIKQTDDKFEESGVPVLEVNRDYYELYSMTLGKKLATLACVLDMPPEIACLLEEM